MNNISRVSFLASRPYLLAIYAEIIANLNTVINYSTQSISLDRFPEKAIAVNPYEIAYLQNKEAGVIELVCFELIQMSFIRVQNNKLEVVTYFSNTSHLEPIEQTIFDFLHTPQTVETLLEDKNLSDAIAEHCKSYRQSLVNQGYINPNRQKYLAAGMSGLLILGLTFGKPLVGMLAGYRYLLLLIGAVMPKASLAIAATAWLGKKSQSRSHLTGKGKQYLAELQENLPQGNLELRSPPVKPNQETSLLFALCGWGIIENSNVETYDHLFDLFSTG